MNITILGGGTAGWLTALFIKKVLPNSNLTLVQSKSIGTVGVGEATTPNLIKYLEEVNINLLDFIKNTDATIKYGINFVNWNNNNSRYMHGFSSILYDSMGVDGLFNNQCFDFYLKYLISNRLNIDEHIYQHKLAYSNKVDTNNAAFALHFNTNKVSSYLENIGISRGIAVVEGIYSNSIQNELGNITSIVLNSGISIDCDFIFDCSGFSRLLIGELFKDKWISYSKYLPVKKAIPFWVNNSSEIEPYTTATAMKYGWMWKTPLQTRSGCGYVFDSDFISADEAKKEVELSLGKEIDINSIIEFSPGRYSKCWINNCIAIGLSSNFIEPLESTSILSSIEQLFDLKFFLNDILSLNKDSIDSYNLLYDTRLDQILNFVYMHYITNRTDTEFWSQFIHNNTMPTKLQPIVEALKAGNIKYFDVCRDYSIPSVVFSLSSYLQVANGIGLTNNFDKYQDYKFRPSIDMHRLTSKNLLNNAIGHSEYLKRIVGNNTIK